MSSRVEDNSLTSSASFLMEALERKAQEIGWNSSVEVPLDTQGRGRAAVLKCRYHSVVIGALSNLKEADDQFHSALLLAYELRAKPEHRHDLTLFLATPFGSIHECEWRQRARQFESDDLVCRKLVWLPPAGPEEIGPSCDAFVARSFLARPWHRVERRTVSPDFFETLKKSLFVRMGDGGEIDPDLLTKWLPILMTYHDTDDKEDLVDQLVSAQGASR